MSRILAIAVLLTACAAPATVPPVSLQADVFAWRVMGWGAAEAFYSTPENYGVHLFDSTGEQIGWVAVFQAGDAREAANNLRLVENHNGGKFPSLHQLGKRSYGYVQAPLGWVGMVFAECYYVVDILLDGQQTIRQIQNYAGVLQRRLHRELCGEAQGRVEAGKRLA